MKEKFQTIEPWLVQILHTIKKEIKTEHLSKSPSFYKTYFGNRPLNRLTNEEICTVYQKELLQGENEEIGEWVINRWVFRHGDIYQHFADRLSQIHPDFDTIKNLDDAQSEKVLSGSVEAFGALPVYLFAILNGVVLSPSALKSLRETAEKEQAAQTQEKAALERSENLEQMLERQKNEMLRLEKKYEDKLAGVMKKHAVDVAALKSQIRSLQHQLSSK
jgi:hypothetical protein